MMITHADPDEKEERIYDENIDWDAHIDNLLWKMSSVKWKRGSSSSSSDWSFDGKTDSDLIESYLNDIEDEETKE